jgi:hypothetical protein
MVLMFFESFAQEVLSPLYSNPELNSKELDKEIRNSQKSNEAVKLPFADDFSYKSKYPSDKNWEDNNVYVNRSFGVNPISIGVASFDAINDTGAVYPSVDQFPSIADYLTSNFIRLDTFFGAIPVKLNPSDSLYLSFHIQAQGNGNKPEEWDSLVLQFYDYNNNEWTSVWNHPGMALDTFRATYNKDFAQILVPIVDAKYFNANFKFRFYNYASIPNSTIPSWRSGMFDLWNIDYIYLNRNRNMHDTTANDVAILTDVNTLLLNYYEMPWNQYLQNPVGEMDFSKTIDFVNRDKSAVNKNVNQYFSITDLDDVSSVFKANPFPSTINMSGNSIVTYAPDYSTYQFQSNASEFADFEVMFRILNNTPPSDLIKSNDTIKFYQKFYNYYAYDDGSSEAGYGLSTINSKLAYQFTLNQPDTLKSIQMYFNSTQDNSSQHYFFLTIWADNNGEPGNIIYEQSGARPEFENKLNKYHTYVLDEAQYVSGTFYVGWRQTTSNNLNLGFDRSSNNQSKIFYNVAGSWQNSQYEGSLMIRPILGNLKYPFVGIENPKTEIEDLVIYPNPVKRNERAFFKSEKSERFLVKVYDLNGNQLDEFESENQISNTDYSPGVYILRFLNLDTNNQVIKKLIITN